MKSVAKLFFGIAFSVIVTVYFVSRFMLDIIGYTTAPDDFELLQKRMPAILEWLFSTPWWVAASFQIAMIALAAWLIVTGTRRAAADEIEEGPGLRRDEIHTLVDGRIDEAITTKLASQFETHSQAHSRDEKLADLFDKVTLARGLAESCQAYAEKRFGDVGIDIRSLEEQVAQLRRDLEAWVQQHNRSQEQRFRNLDGGFRAIGDREKLAAIAERIDAGAKWLLQTSEGQKLDWMRFDLKLDNWRRELASYGTVASHYLQDVPALIRDVPAHKLSGDWPEDRSLFPNDDAMLAHRTVAIMHQNFMEQHERVMSCVESFAFNSPSMKGIGEA